MNNQFKKIVDTYFFEEMNIYSVNSLIGHRTAINHFLGRIGKREPASFTKQDILRYFNSDKFQRLNASSQNLYKRHLKKFFRWYEIEDSFLQKIKKRREKLKTFRKGDLISLKDLEKMIKNTDSLQYKCLIIVLYETSGRVDEIRNIRIEDITQYESYTSIFLNISKTIQRNIPVIQAIPYINQWLNNHPKRDNPKAYLFLREYRKTYARYSRTGIYTIIKKVGECLKKNIYPHLFRHSRLTELAKYLTEAELCRFAGWSIGSKQVRRYVHLAHEDVENKILSIHGITLPKESEPKTVITTIK